MSPRAACAPAFICLARPRWLSTTRSQKGAARLAVPSVLSPSATIISAPGTRSRRFLRNLRINDASLKTGTMIETCIASFHSRTDSSVLQIFPAKNVVFVDCHFDGRLFRLSPCQRERTEVRGSSFADAPVPWSNPHPPPLPCEGRGDPCDARRTAD